MMITGEHGRSSSNFETPSLDVCSRFDRAQPFTDFMRGPVVFVVACLLLGACAHTPRVEHAPQAASAKPMPPPRSPRECSYAAVLSHVLRAYEADLTAASERWYPSYAESARAADEFIHPSFALYMRAAMHRYGVRRSELESYALSHPEFVRDQNEVFRERMMRLRPIAYSILGRIDSDHPSLAVAIEDVASLATPLTELASVVPGEVLEGP
jgi:hypothetical protein